MYVCYGKYRYPIFFVNRLSLTKRIKFSVSYIVFVCEWVTTVVTYSTLKSCPFVFVRRIDTIEDMLASSPAGASCHINIHHFRCYYTLSKCIRYLRETIVSKLKSLLIKQRSSFLNNISFRDNMKCDLLV